MMNLFRQYQTVITFIVVVIVAYLGYQYFFAPSNEEAITVTETPNSGVDQDLIALLLELRSIRLDNEIFADPLFQSLTDFSKELVSEPVGRPNPFAPFGVTTPPKPGQ